MIHIEQNSRKNESAIIGLVIIRGRAFAIINTKGMRRDTAACKRLVLKAAAAENGRCETQ